MADFISFFILMELVNASYEHILYINSKVICDALLLYKVKLELFVNIHVFELIRIVVLMFDVTLFTQV